MSAAFDLSAYCARISHPAPTTAGPLDAAGLAAMMRAQLFAVPFENLDVQAGKGVSLDPGDIVDKIVRRRRGGYCYEVNGLFAMALEATGTPFTMVAARPMFYPARRPRTHMALIARVDDADWLVDLGFGSYGPRAPLRLDRLDAEIAQDDDRYRLRREENGEFVLSAKTPEGWADQYGFHLHPQEWVDFAPVNHLNATHPDAIFVRTRLLIRHHPRGRDILIGRTLKRVRGGRVETREIADEETPAVFESLFGLGGALARGPAKRKARA
jgi:N-hydroxyarylamine O-acetyltransferase